VSWRSLEEADPDLAVFCAERLHGRVSYLATLRRDGAPRVHPMTPIIGEGHLFVFMEPTSPKGHDLERDGRYAIHCSVTDNSGESGEVIVSGHATPIVDRELRSLAVRLATYAPADRYVLFEFGVERVATTTYPGGRPERRFWKS
jgi:hypothetical protein